MDTWFAAIDTGMITGAVYGIGSSPDEARRDATENGYSCTEDSDTMRIVPITDAAKEFVLTHGGAPDRELVVSNRGRHQTSDRTGVWLRSEEGA